MNFPLYVARRYLFSKKSHHAINIISLISVIGVALASAALVVVLSVFNGFHDLVASLFTAFDPQLEIVAARGKTFSLDDKALQGVSKLSEVAVTSGCLENRALARYNGRQTMVMLKGVDDNYGRCTDIESILYGTKTFKLHADVLNYAIPGIRLAMLLGMSTDFDLPLEIFTPRPGERVDMIDPTTSFNQGELESSGNVFNVSQKEYDQNYVLCPLKFAQEMFEKPGEVSSMAIRLRQGADTQSAKQHIQQQVGPHYRVLDRYEQQEDVFRIMKVEKLMAYLFLTFILFIASFNIIASLSMLIIDKRDDIQTLRDLGAQETTIRRIFLTEGRLISLAGAVIGILVGGRGGHSALGYHIMTIGILFFCVVIFFQLVTLPVEFNASNRALQNLRELRLVNEEDYVGSRTVLRAAAMTYVAALATAVASLLRVFVIAGSNRR